MNRKRILLYTSALFMILAASLSGTACNREKAAGDELNEPPAETSQYQLENRSGNAGEFRPVSDRIVAQIEDSYASWGIRISSLERSRAGSQSLHLVLVPRDGVPVHKELLDGLLVLKETFPNLGSYSVRIEREGDPQVDASWPVLAKLAEAGYSLDTAGAQVEEFWNLVQEANDTARQQASLPSVESGDGAGSTD